MVLSAYLEGFLRQLSAAQISEAICWLIVLGLGLACVLSILGRSPAFVAYTPTLMTSLGIFGTFVGIVVGLLAFDSRHINTSIEGLLAGLKTAFVTSLVGMVGSILFKVLHSTRILDASTQEELTEDVVPEQIYAAICAQKQQLEALRQAIAGDGDGTLVSQLKLLRGDLNDNHKMMHQSLGRAESHLTQLEKYSEEQHRSFNDFSDKLWIKMQDFADMLSKSATEQVINALKEVIVDFNQNLTEQFGENFKALNAAVERLVIWQENYRQQLADMIEQYKQGVTAITQTESAVASISQESKVIPAAMENLKSVMEINRHQLDELQRHLAAFKDIRDRAVEAVPQIREQIDATVEAITASVDQASQHYTRLLSESDIYIQAYRHTAEKLLGDFADTTRHSIDDMAQKMAEGAKQIRSDIIKGAEDWQHAVTKTMNDASEQSRNMLSESVKQFHAQLEESKSLTGQFVIETRSGIELVGKELNKSAVDVGRVISNGVKDFEGNVHKMNDSLTSTVDNMQSHTEAIQKQLKNTVTELNSRTQNMLDELVQQSKELNKTLSTANQDLVNDTRAVRDHVSTAIQDMQKRLEDSLQAVFQAQSREAQRAFDTLGQEIQRAIGLAGEAVNKELKYIDQAMQTEIERVMQQMGQALATISGHFTDDYRRLVDAMAKVVNGKVV